MTTVTIVVEAVEETGEAGIAEEVVLAGEGVVEEAGVLLVEVIAEEEEEEEEAPEIIMLFVSIYIAYCDYGPISPHKDKELIEPCPPEPAFEPHEEAGEEAPVVQEDIRVEYREELAEEPKKVEVKKLDGESNAQLLF
ncbi:hypothetical protein CAPTEDRAFT_210036 [Capitella teleta]|uniref:Uncharacterized protein n=1 Tax=Capitella teleta TaxID=283909 RepID=R7V2X0_CAPTE|nr:hypothetical protein CAPTEDRAFT_210036 [Capitella teleta]|eukprot:ELU13173.1 hypothetical protein CAPTEDRAFT_210036 [Capitella teleta]